MAAPSAAAAAAAHLNCGWLTPSCAASSKRTLAFGGWNDKQSVKCLNNHFFRPSPPVLTICWHCTILGMSGLTKHYQSYFRLCPFTIFPPNVAVIKRTVRLVAHVRVPRHLCSDSAAPHHARSHLPPGRGGRGDPAGWLTAPSWPCSLSDGTRVSPGVRASPLNWTASACPRHTRSLRYPVSPAGPSVKHF